MIAGIETNTTPSYLAEFELKVIAYTSRRIDYWVEDLRKTVERDKICPDWNYQGCFEQEAAVKDWTIMTDFILRFEADRGSVISRPRIVQQAYKCLSLTQVRQLLSDTFGTQVSLKIWSKLNFIARPLVDCRLLRSIAAREPQLQNCKISPISSKSKTTLEAKYVIVLFDAWQRLGLGLTPEPMIRILDPFTQRFEKACAETFSMHAEMQLLMHYEEGYALRPTLDYFGCSKKTCLLCETILCALSSPIATRGRTWCLLSCLGRSRLVFKCRKSRCTAVREEPRSSHSRASQRFDTPQSDKSRCECHAIRYSIRLFALYS
jgi:hypothetical protein